MFSVLKNIIFSIIGLLVVYTGICMEGLRVVSVQAVNMHEIMSMAITRDIPHRLKYYDYLMTFNDQRMSVLHWLPIINFRLSVQANKDFSQFYDYTGELKRLFDNLKLSARGYYWKELIDNIQNMRQYFNKHNFLDDVMHMSNYLVYYLNQTSLVLDKRKLRILRDYQRGLTDGSIDQDYNKILYDNQFEIIDGDLEYLIINQIYDNIDLKNTNQRLQSIFNLKNNSFLIRVINPVSSYDNLSLEIDQIIENADIWKKDSVTESLINENSPFDITIKKLESDNNDLQDIPAEEISSRALLLHDLRKVKDSIIQGRKIVKYAFSKSDAISYDENNVSFFARYVMQASEFFIKKLDILNIDYGFDISYRLFNGGKFLFMNSVLEYNRNVAYYQHVVAKNQVIIDALKRYLDIIKLDAEISVLTAKLEDLKSFVKQADIKYTRGVISLIDIEDLKLRVQEVVKNLSQKNIDRHKLTYEYYVKFNDTMTEILPFPIFPELYFDRNSIYTDIQMHNPYVNIMYNKMQLNRFSSYVEMSTSVPVVDIFFGWSKSYDVITQRNRGSQWRSGLSLSWDIHTPAHGQNNYRSKMFDSLRSRRLTLSISNNMQLQAMVLMNKIQGNQSHLELSAEQISQLKNKIKLYLVKLDQDNIDFSEIIDIKTKFWQKQIKFYHNYITKIYDIITLWSLIGDLSIVIPEALNNHPVLVNAFYTESSDATQESDSMHYQQQKFISPVDQMIHQYNQSIKNDIVNTNYEIDLSPNLRDLFRALPMDKFPPSKLKSNDSNVMVEKLDDYHWRMYQKQSNTTRILSINQR